MMKFIVKNKDGTALLVALLVMGVFMAVSLALSSLILRETRITISFINAGQAYYSAESGIEMGLYGLNTQLPGWQPIYDDADRFKSFKLDDEFKTVGQFKLQNRCRAYPCFDEEEYDLSSLSDVPKYFYDVLELNQSLTIPLFVADPDPAAPNGVTIKNPTDFVVEFFTPLNPEKHLKFGENTKLSGWDVLRWKLIGIRKDGSGPGAGETETISDFTAVSMVTVNNTGAVEPDEIVKANATFPSWFGTIDCDGVEGSGGIENRYSSGIKCPSFGELYPATKGDSGEFEIATQNFDQIAKIQAGNCLPWQAREFYVYEYDNDGAKVVDVEGCYDIKTFLNTHTLNYLVLTNLVNPAVLRTDDGDGPNGSSYSRKEILSRLFFRVELGAVQGEAGDPNPDLGESAYTVRPVASITANGYSGESKQSINVKIKRGSFMPVFNFSLYSTYIEENTDYSDWYEGLVEED